MAMGICFGEDAGGSYKNIFVLAGQSNMVGRGSVGDLISERQPDPLIQRFAANRTWEMAADPLHIDIDIAPNKSAGVGPGMPFAKTLIQRNPNLGVIGLVPCAIGDTSITEWSKGSPFPYYNNTVARARAAFMDGGVLRAILWYQGEKDVKLLEDAMAYKARFQKFIDDIQLPLLPVIEVALDYEVISSNLELVRKAQFEIVNERQNVSCVDANGLQISWDHWHLTTAAQLKLGALMADAFLRLEN